MSTSIFVIIEGFSLTSYNFRFRKQRKFLSPFPAFLLPIRKKKETNTIQFLLRSPLPFQKKGRNLFRFNFLLFPFLGAGRKRGCKNEHTSVHSFLFSFSSFFTKRKQVERRSEFLRPISYSSLFPPPILFKGKRNKKIGMIHFPALSFLSSF